MTQPPPSILDYASPKRHEKSRIPMIVPLRSVVSLHADADYLLVTERLEAKGEAYGGIAFGTFVQVWLTILFFTVKHSGCFVGPLWAVNITILLMVVQDAFRRTRLEVWPDRLALDLRSPFRRRTYSWPTTELATVALTPHADNLSTLTLALTNGQAVHLFTGHPYATLDAILRHVDRVARVVPLGQKV
jgi:hypothetical protein